MKKQAIENEEEKKELLKYYYEEKHYGQDKCAKLLGPGIGRSTVKKWLKELNLPIRDFEEAKRYMASHRREKDEEYFSTENANMAWILGFLASDGTVGSKDNHIKIGLAAKDKEILEKIKQEIKIENKITEYETNKGYDVVELFWTCAQHKKDLAKYNIIPNKTFNLKPPYELNRKYWIDYIRGYFDGDGSISTHKNGISFSICGASKEVLEWIVDFFYEEYNIPKVNIHIDKRRDRPFYYFSYATTSSKKIYNILYKTSSNLFLKRKKNRYEELIKLQDINFHETTVPHTEE